MLNIFVESNIVSSSLQPYLTFRSQPRAPRQLHWVPISHWERRGGTACCLEKDGTGRAEKHLLFPVCHWGTNLEINFTPSLACGSCSASSSTWPPACWQVQFPSELSDHGDQSGGKSAERKRLWVWEAQGGASVWTGPEGGAGLREERGILRAPDIAGRPTPWSHGMHMSIGLVDFVYLVNSFMV